MYKLAGTGSSAPTGGWRAMLENNLKKQGFNNVKELLDDPNRTTSLVVVSAVVPPGVRKGTPLDVQVGLPDESRTTSLKGGVLLTCDMVNVENSNNLRAAAADGNGPPKPGPNGLLMGSVMARASGPILAGSVATPATARAESAADPDDPAADRPTLRAGRIWDGAKSLIGRPYYLLLNPGDQRVQLAMQVTERLNATFMGNGEPGQKVAEAKTKELVLVHVPPAYRHNHYRFLLVARQVPLAPAAADGPYRRKLEEELLDPATAQIAALKLEALGSDSQRALRTGLESDSPWVRFASAEALAYLGQTNGAAELAKLAEAHAALRAPCLKALASVDDASSTDRLVDLMAGGNPEVRFGAFLALRLADDQHPAVRGQVLNHAFKLYRAAPGGEGLVHLTSDGRGDVVVFGDDVRFKGPFTLPAGNEFTVSLPAAEPTVTVSRIVRVKGEPEVKTATCTPDVAAVLATMAKLGGGQAESVELLRRAERAQILTAELAVDAIPRQFGVDQLVAYAKTDPALYKADREVAKIGTLVPDAAESNDILAETDAKPDAAATPTARKLSRDPGRLFGPKRTTDPEDDPLPLPLPALDDGVTPAGGTDASASREPGRLFAPKRRPPADE